MKTIRLYFQNLKKEYSTEYSTLKHSKTNTLLIMNINKCFRSTVWRKSVWHANLHGCSHTMELSAPARKTDQCGEERAWTRYRVWVYIVTAQLNLNTSWCLFNNGVPHQKILRHFHATKEAKLNGKQNQAWSTNSTSTQVKVGLQHNSVLNMELLKYFQETLQADFRLNRAISQDLKKAIQCALDGTNQLLFSNTKINIYLLWSHFEDKRVDNK